MTEETDIIVENAIIEQSGKEDAINLKILLDKRDAILLSEAAQYASVPGIRCLLDRLSPDFPNANQIVLEYSAMAGNFKVFDYMIENCQDLDLGVNLRYYAISGGVEIWKILLKIRPELLDEPIGHFGDPLALSVHKENNELVVYLLKQGADAKDSNLSGISALRLARKNQGITADTLRLLESYVAD
ncbi:hypothetical protein N7495_009152 [Penicillium taxi]|uniref:uncharacterized protein n=1 Tax=Penicillium taxi TaxID=168475 RepID=UPI0025458C49|nr:uncharacterized protein N7495_009152 [Penicillium taxi]KAJ5884642.1 hypothetical protein N7495_009152 [Penicillium taxi]